MMSTVPSLNLKPKLKTLHFLGFQIFLMLGMGSSFQDVLTAENEHIFQSSLRFKTTAQIKHEIQILDWNPNPLHGLCQRNCNHGKKVQTYMGPVKEGPITGKGELKYKDGGSYQGELKDGKRDGKGKMTYRKEAQQLYHKGGWKDDKQYGWGLRVYLDKGRCWSYFGDWNGRKSGLGIMNLSNGSIYIGRWHEGERHDDKGMVIQNQYNIKGYTATWKEGKVVRGTKKNLSENSIEDIRDYIKSFKKEQAQSEGFEWEIIPSNSPLRQIFQE